MDEEVNILDVFGGILGLEDTDSDEERMRKINDWMVEIAIEKVERTYGVTILDPRITQSFPWLGTWFVKGKDPNNFEGRPFQVSDYEIIISLTAYDPATGSFSLRVESRPWGPSLH